MQIKKKKEEEELGQVQKTKYIDWTSGLHPRIMA
jgi:hypothetical protein